MNGAKYASPASVRRCLDELGIRPTHYGLKQRELEIAFNGARVTVSLALPLMGGEERVLERIREVFQ